MAIVEQHSKANNFLTRVDFSFEHPIEEIGRVLYAVLLKHLGLGYVLLPILDACKCTYFCIEFATAIDIYNMRVSIYLMTIQDRKIIKQAKDSVW